MDKKEKKIIENLDYMTEDVQIPDSLKPEAVEEMLKAHKAEKSRSRKKRFCWKPAYKGAMAAAALFLVISGVAARGDLPAAGLPERRISNIIPKKDFAGEVKEGIEPIAHPDNYREVFKYIKAYHDRMKMCDNGKGRDSVIKEDAFFETSKDSTAYTGYSYSETNVRTEGVSEGDIVKTDGKYLYILKYTMNQIAIVDVRGEEMKEVSGIQFEKGTQICEFYIEDGKLIALGTDYEESVNGQTETMIVTYDISDPANIKEAGTVTQSGNYDSSRIADGYLYVFSNFYAVSDCGVYETELYIPKSDGELIPKEDILLPLRKEGCGYYVVASVDLKKPDEIKDSKGIFHNGGLTYVSSENIYLCETSYDKNKGTITYIRKIAYKDGKLIGKASGEIPGRLESSFSIDEYDGYLRMVVTKDNAEVPTEIKTSNAVYVLDEKLKIVGSIENLAEDEKIYSARFMEDTAYFVTYRQVDPLFSVDLSDPVKPEIIGSLKIPGFSEYLHPYGDGILLGIGMDMDEEGVTSNGIKLSMFDISNPSDVKEVHKLVLPQVYGSPAMSNYKAVLIDTEKNMIGFSAYSDNEKYYIFSYDKEKGFCKCMEEGVNNTSGLITKGLYISDKLYVVGGNIIEAYKIPSYEKVDDLILSDSKILERK